jgi:SAM-dependent methyltransferase
MFDGVGLCTGMQVLDVAAGTGDQSVLAAQKVGPTGSVFATDISSSMLAGAEQAAYEAGVNNVRTSVQDASALELPEAHFDAAICRFGLMFLPDLHQALSRIRHSLKPGARFAALVWSTEEHNPWIGVQLATVREMDRMPSPPPPIVRTTSLSAPGVLGRAFDDAGFHDVRTEAVATPREFESHDEANKAMWTTSPNQAELLRDMTDDERERFRAEVERRLAAHVQPDGRCVVPGEAVLGVGTA